MKVLVFIFFFHLSFAYAVGISDIEKNRGAFGEQQISVEGIISELRHHKKKYDEYYEFKLKDKFRKEYIQAKFYLIFNDQKVNTHFSCLEGQFITLTGNFYAKMKGSRLGDLLIEGKSSFSCAEDNRYKKIEKTYSIDNLKDEKEKLNNQLIKVTGYIKNLRMSYTRNKTNASFKLVDSSKKKYLSVKLLVASDGKRVINNFKCHEGENLTLSGAFLANLKSKSDMGKLIIISKEFMQCNSTQKLTLSASELQRVEKQKRRELKSQLEILFRRYKDFFHNRKKTFDQDEFTKVYNQMKEICMEGIKLNELSELCAKISYYARAMEQRNQLSFKIQSAMKNMADWNQLYKYSLPETNSVLEIIKAIYPLNSDYIIGIPARCYPDQQFNPSASNFPYRLLGVSKYAKKNFTAILHRFNDPKLKCGNLMDSIFMIGNMDTDEVLEVIKIDPNARNFLRVIRSDI